MATGHATQSKGSLNKMLTHEQKERMHEVEEKNDTSQNAQSQLLSLGVTPQLMADESKVSESQRNLASEEDADGPRENINTGHVTESNVNEEAEFKLDEDED